MTRKLIERLAHFAREGSAPINDACGQAVGEIERLHAALALARTCLTTDTPPATRRKIEAALGAEPDREQP
jgi:hypothetical protein